MAKIDTSKVTRFEIIDHVPCQACGGDGKEHCNNPDHNFTVSLGNIGRGDIGRLGCPTCKFPESTVVANGGFCESCNGDGMGGRTVVAYDKDLQFSVELQDDDRTLKVFIHERFEDESKTI